MSSHHSPASGSAAELLARLKAGGSGYETAGRGLLQTGFTPLDQALGGGLARGGLTVLGGAPGIGKTVAALQWARSLAVSGHTVSYVCYEHDEAELLGRLLVHEASLLVREQPDVLEKLHTVLQEMSQGVRELDDVGELQPLVDYAVRQISDFGVRLGLVAASGRTTGLDELREFVAASSARTEVLFVDYLQKVALTPEPTSEEEKIRRVTEGLKDLTLDEHLAVVALAATDRAGIELPRLRLHHLRGSTAVAYEADAVILLNDKIRIVSKSHLAYDATRAEDFRRQVVFTIEKNRRGEAGLDLEFEKDFVHFRFQPEGRYVAERLVDERFDPD